MLQRDRHYCVSRCIMGGGKVEQLRESVWRIGHSENGTQPNQHFARKEPEGCSSRALGIHGCATLGSCRYRYPVLHPLDRASRADSACPAVLTNAWNAGTSSVDQHWLFLVRDDGSNSQCRKRNVLAALPIPLQGSGAGDGRRGLLSMRLRFTGTSGGTHLSGMWHFVSSRAHRREMEGMGAATRLGTRNRA